MKSSRESRPRLLCRAVRGWSMIAGEPTADAAARHIVSCSACQKFFATSASLDARLRAAAPHRAQVLPEGFEQRMERVLAPLTRAPAAEETGSRRVLWSFFGSLAAAAVVALLLFRPADAPHTGPAVLVGQQVEAPAAAARPPSNAVLLGLAGGNPLQQEIDYVYADARAALRFLALNFLPPGAVDAPSS